MKCLQKKNQPFLANSATNLPIQFMPIQSDFYLPKLLRKKMNYHSNRLPTIFFQIVLSAKTPCRFRHSTSHM